MPGPEQVTNLNPSTPPTPPPNPGDKPTTAGLAETPTTLSTAGTEGRTEATEGRGFFGKIWDFVCWVAWQPFRPIAWLWNKLVGKPAPEEKPAEPEPAPEPTAADKAKTEYEMYKKVNHNDFFNDNISVDVKDALYKEIGEEVRSKMWFWTKVWNKIRGTSIIDLGKVAITDAHKRKCVNTHLKAVSDEEEKKAKPQEHAPTNT